MQRRRHLQRRGTKRDREANLSLPKELDRPQGSIQMRIPSPFETVLKNCTHILISVSGGSRKQHLAAVVINVTLRFLCIIESSVAELGGGIYNMRDLCVSIF